MWYVERSSDIVYAETGIQVLIRFIFTVNYNEYMHNCS